MFSGKTYIGNADFGDSGQSARRCLSDPRDRLAQFSPALFGDGFEQFALILKVMIRRGRADARLPSNGPKR